MADYTGDSGDNSVKGGAGSEIFDYSQGGHDTIKAGGGNDSIWGGAGVDALDRFDGGDGQDSLELLGDYSAGVTFQATTIQNIEYLYVYATGSAIVHLAEGNIAAGHSMQVNVGTANVVLDGSALTTGALSFSVFADETRLYGTANTDFFNLWTGAFALTRDNVYDGGAGDDTLGFLGAFTLRAAGHTFQNIEHMSASSDFSLVLADGNIAAGATMTFNENAPGGSKIFLDDHKETDGHLSAVGGLSGDRFFAGALADSLSGGEGDDVLRGGHGGDALSGGGGSDIFVYTSVLDSVRGAVDLISDLDDTDFIDLSHLDADKTTDGLQHFTLVEAFGGHAGELVLFYDAGRDVTHLRGDVDGDGRADLSIDIAGDHSDFAGVLLDFSG